MYFIITVAILAKGPLAQKRFLRHVVLTRVVLAHNGEQELGEVQMSPLPQGRRVRGGRSSCDPDSHRLLHLSGHDRSHCGTSLPSFHMPRVLRALGCERETFRTSQANPFEQGLEQGSPLAHTKQQFGRTGVAASAASALPGHLTAKAVMELLTAYGFMRRTLDRLRKSHKKQKILIFCLLFITNIN